jgi:hypothetical protein
VSVPVRRLSMLLVIVVTAAGATARAAGTDRDAQREALAENRSLWTSQHLRDYRFRLRVTCFCTSRGHAVVISVRNGRPHAAAGGRRRLDTIPELFAAIRRALDDPDSGDVTVSYDHRRGFPRRASIDPIKNAADDEISWTVDRFQALVRSPASRVRSARRPT